MKHEHIWEYDQKVYTNFDVGMSKSYLVEWNNLTKVESDYEKLN